MQIFKKEITVTTADLDDLNHVNNVRYVQWVQDIAQAHWLQNASKSILDNYVWMLVKHTINYKGQAFLNDTLQIKTFVLKSEGVTSTRHVEMTNLKTNKTIITSETTWCFINAKTKKPTRITTEVANLFK